MKFSILFVVCMLAIAIMPAQESLTIDPLATAETKALFRNLHLLSENDTLFLPFIDDFST